MKSLSFCTILTPVGSVFTVVVFLTIFFVTNSSALSISASLTPRTAEFTGVCPVTIGFDGAISGETVSTVKYRFIRSDGGKSDPQTAIALPGGTINVHTSWTRGISSQPTKPTRKPKHLKEQVREGIERWKDKAEDTCEMKYKNNASKLKKCLADVENSYIEKTTYEVPAEPSGDWVAIEVLSPEHVVSPKAYFSMNCVTVDGSGKNQTISSALFGSDFQIALNETAVQISHTSGEIIYGDPERVPKYLKDQVREGAEKWRDEAEDKCEQKFTNNPTQVENCLAAVRKRYLEKTTEIVVPTYQSWVKFSDTLVGLSNGNLSQTMPLDVPIYELDLPSSAIGALAAASGGLYTVDKARVLVNNINTTISLDQTIFNASISDNGFNFSFSLNSNHPTLITQGHACWVLGMICEWNDTAIPDHDLERMKITIKLVPMVTPEGQLSYHDAYVIFNADISAGAAELVDFFVNYQSKLKIQVASELRKALLQPNVRNALGKALMGVVQKEARVNKIQQVKVVGNNLIVTY